MRSRSNKPGTRIALLAIVSTILVGSVHAEAAQVAWRTDVIKAAREAKTAQKPMLLQIGASWCGYCKKMLRNTYTDTSVIQHVNGCFIPVKVDADQEEKLVEAIGIEGLPTTVIISPDFKILKKLTGYKSARELDAQLGQHCPAQHQASREPSQSKPKSRVQPSSRKTLAKSNTAVNSTPKSYAFGKLCLVTLLDDKELALGSTKYISVYQSKTVCFTSEEFKKRFEASPEKYWPVLDGNCPVSEIDNRDGRTGDPEMAVIYQGKIWLCADLASRGKFAKSPRVYSQAKFRATAKLKKSTGTRRR